MADALVLGTSGQPWEFESPLLYHEVLAQLVERSTVTGSSPVHLTKYQTSFLIRSLVLILE